MQGHLDLARATDGVGYDAQATWTAVEAAGDSPNTGCVAGARQYRRTSSWEGVVACVLSDFVTGNVEAGGIGEVVDIEGVLEAVPVREVGDFDERGISAFLEVLAEDVALAGGEAGFKGIGSGDGSAQTACREDRKGETGRVEGGFSIGNIERAGVTGPGGLGCATRG